MEFITFRDYVSQFGSPLFVIREDKIIAAFTGLESVMADLFGSQYAIAYAIKANPTVSLCKTMFKRGAWADTAWLREVDLALSLDVTPSRIILNGPYKPEQILREALAAGLHVDLETPLQVETAVNILSETKNRGIGIRLKPLEIKERSRFGLDPEEAISAVAYCKKRNIPIDGLHIHYYEDKWPPTLAQWLAKAEKLFQLAAIISESQGPLRYLNIGGGLPEPLIPDPSFDDFAAQARLYMEPIAAMFQQFKKRRDSETILIVEPGRFLVQHSTVLVTTAIDLFHQSTQTTIVLDAGVSSLASLSSWEGDINVESGQTKVKKLVRYVGPSCMEQDVLISGRNLPVAEVGSLIVFDRVGAYHIPHSTAFAENRPSIVWVAINGHIEDLGSFDDWSQWRNKGGI